MFVNAEFGHRPVSLSEYFFRSRELLMFDTSTCENRSLAEKISLQCFLGDKTFSELSAL